MKIGIIADTHLSQREDPEKFKSLLDQLSSSFKDVDRIIHAGDVCDKKLLRELETIAPTICVKGEEDQRLDEPQFKKIKAGIYKIGIIHQLPDHLKDFFDQNELDILIHGHTHYPLIKGTPYDKLLLNPGSPTNPKKAPKKTGFDEPRAKKTVLTLKIDEDTNMFSTFIVNLKT
ncbi:MAG: metallophosphoesterase family protein [Promethearchaeia archaeon]